MFNSIPANMNEVEGELKSLCTKIVAGTYPQLIGVLFDTNADRKRYKLRMIMSMCDIIDKMNAQEINESEEAYIVGMLDDAIKTNAEQYFATDEYLSSFEPPKKVHIKRPEDITAIVDDDTEFDDERLYHDAEHELWVYKFGENKVIQISDNVPVPEIVDCMKTRASSNCKPLMLRSVLSAILAIEMPND